jgi:hypothetical protein
VDAKVFGATYPYTGALPYASGFVHYPTDNGSNRVDCAASRALFVESRAGGGGGYICVELSDAPGQNIRIEELKGDMVLPISCTAVISGDITEVLVLY